MAIASANRIRIIGGAWRGRIVRFPSVAGLRPTPDRVRETLFNWLGQDLSGRCCLDLYSGTGALSLEAASRGAALAVAVERNRSLVTALRATAALIGSDAIDVVAADARSFLEGDARVFDVIFADPPFDEEPWPWLLPACGRRLAEGGLLYAEARHAIAAEAPFAPWRRDKAGQVHYHLFAKVT